MPDRSCVQRGRLVCCDDLCHGVDQTLCGLYAGIDFHNGFCDPHYRDCDECFDEDEVFS